LGRTFCDGIAKTGCEPDHVSQTKKPLAPAPSLSPRRGPGHRASSGGGMKLVNTDKHALSLKHFARPGADPL
jgi:hypothetical protein